MTMLKIMVYGLAAILGLYSSHLLAKVGVYQIELIIFSQVMPNTEVFEQTDSQINWPFDLTELSAYKKPDNTTLDDHYAALLKDPAYRPILHVAWVQLVGKGELSVPVHIQSSDGKLNGYLLMQQDQGLRMTVDLELSSNSGDGFSKTVVYRLNEKRSIKLNEVYYLDHPKFGLVIKISAL